jgi:hypothetical protein
VRPRSSLYFSAKGIASQSSLALKLVNEDIAAQDIGVTREPRALRTWETSSSGTEGKEY